MKRIRSLIQDHSLLLELGIWLLFMLWATQLNSIMFNQKQELACDWSVSEKSYTLETIVSESSVKTNEYADLFRNGSTAVDELLEKLDKLSWSHKLVSLFSWLKVFYLRGLVLAFALFALRMVSRKGFLATFLADKKKFFVAVLAWPCYLLRYPHNVVREIRVEAELRRLGNISRKLNPSEKKLVRQVAAGRDYKNWLAGFRLAYAQLFQRGLAVAVLATIVVNLLPSVCLSFDSQSAWNKTEQILQIDERFDCGDGDSLNSDMAIIDAFSAILFLCLGRTYLRLFKTCPGTQRTISHVPLGSFV